MKQIIKDILGIDQRRAQRKLEDLEGLLAAGFPAPFAASVRYLITKERDLEAAGVATKIEGLRAEIAAQGDKEIDIIYSPKPGSAGETVTSDLRPEHGKVLKFTMKKVAATGKDSNWGTVLHLLARDHAIEEGFELGACAGLSACYLGSVPSIRELVTVEGSEALSEVAKQTTARMSSKIRVVSGLFDDVLDMELPTRSRIDFAYIDGHHEKIATLHYLDRFLPHLKPGALVVFDDIYWSDDMNEAWREVTKNPVFSDAVDYGMIGVCLVKDRKDESQPKFWDLRPLVGCTPIQEPKGWEK